MSPLFAAISLLAQAAPPGGGMLSAFLVPALIVGIFYFLVLRPQQKQLREQQDFRDALKVDDRVITTSGIWGKIVEIDSQRVLVEVAPKVRIHFSRVSIATMQPKEGGGDTTDKPGARADEKADAKSDAKSDRKSDKKDAREKEKESAA